MENGDIKIMEEMKGREIPLLYDVAYANKNPEDRYLGDERMIEAIAHSGNEEIYNYFSEEFQIENRFKCVGKYLYPDLGNVIDLMLKEKGSNCDAVRMMVRRVVDHNKNSYEEILKKVNDFYQENYETEFGSIPEELAPGYRKRTMWSYCIDHATHIVSFRDGSADGVRTNIIPISATSDIASLKSLIDEANEWYDKIANFEENFINGSMEK
jgi:hypothetical protein